MRILSPSIHLFIRIKTTDDAALFVRLSKVSVLATQMKGLTCERPRRPSLQRGSLRPPAPIAIIRGVSRISFVGPYLAQLTEPIQRGIITSVRGFKDRQSNAQSRLCGTSNHCRFGRFESMESCPA